MKASDGVERSDLRGYLRVLRSRALVIILSATLVVGLAMAYSFVKRPVYSATASVLVPQQQAASALDIQNTQSPAAASLQRSLADEQQFAEGDAVRKAADRSLGYDADTSVGSSTSADILTFTSTSGDASAAAGVANTYAETYTTQRRDSQVLQYAQQVTALQTSIAGLQSQAESLPTGSAQQLGLQESIQTLTQSVRQTQAAAEVASQVGPIVVKAATVPQAPTSPKPVRNGILGLVVGLVLGVGLAFLLDRLDDRITSRQVAEESSGGLPVVGTIPKVPAWRGKGGPQVALLVDPSSNVAEAYRSLRTAVQFVGIDSPMRVVGITSALAGEGKTTAVANLAVSFSRSGLRVIVVSCDLRRPRIQEIFKVRNDVGLTSVILGRASVTDVMLPALNEPRLRLVPSGPIPPNPAEILSLDHIRTIVQTMIKNSDIVLLDCPPVLPVTDTLLLSRVVDGMLMVASARSTSRRDLHRSYEMLRQVGAPLLGTVLNQVPTQGGKAYGYGYGYGYGYSPDPDSGASVPWTPQPMGAAHRSDSSIDKDGSPADRTDVLISSGAVAKTTAGSNGHEDRRLSNDQIDQARSRMLTN
jgi:capsular exopolysaccharide synthesis family protein